MNTEQTDRVAQLEEEIRLLKQGHFETLQELSVSYQEAINKANRFEKENHVLQMKLQAETEKAELKRKRPSSSPVTVIGILLMGLLITFIKCSN